MARKLTAAQGQVARLAGERAALVRRMHEDEGMTMGLIAQTLGVSHESKACSHERRSPDYASALLKPNKHLRRIHPCG